jgi:hypothetical protein
VKEAMSLVRDEMISSRERQNEWREDAHRRLGLGVVLASLAVCMWLGPASAAAATTTENFKVWFAGTTPSTHPYTSQFTTYDYPIENSEQTCSTERDETTHFSFVVAGFEQVRINGRKVLGFSDSNVTPRPLVGEDNSSHFDYSAHSGPCGNPTFGPPQDGDEHCSGTVRPGVKQPGTLSLSSGSKSLTLKGVGPVDFLAVDPFTGTSTFRLPHTSCAQRTNTTGDNFYLVDPAFGIALVKLRYKDGFQHFLQARMTIPAKKVRTLRVGQEIREPVSPGDGAPSVAGLNGNCHAQLTDANYSCTESFDWQGYLYMKRIS